MSLAPCGVATSHLTCARDETPAHARVNTRTQVYEGMALSGADFAVVSTRLHLLSYLLCPVLLSLPRALTHKYLPDKHLTDKYRVSGGQPGDSE